MSLGQPEIQIIEPSRKFAQKATNIAFSQQKLLLLVWSYLLRQPILSNVNMICIQFDPTIDSFYELIHYFLILKEFSFV